MRICTATLLLISALAFSACAPKAIVVEPLAPTAARLAETSRETVVKAKRVDSAAKNVQRKSSDLQAEIVKGMLEADRVRKAGLATQTDLDANAEAWNVVHDRNLFLEAAMKTWTIDTQDLVNATAKVSTDAENLAGKVVTQDAVVQTLKTDIVRQADDAAVGKLLKRSLWAAVILVILFFILKVTLPLIRPL